MPSETDHTPAVAALRLAALQRYAHLRTSQLVLLFGTQGELLYCNRVARRYLGLSAAAAGLPGLSELDLPMDWAAAREQWWPQAQLGRQTLQLTLNQHKQRRHCWAGSEPIEVEGRRAVLVYARIECEHADRRTANLQRDPLTGLLNRQGFEEELRRLMQLAREGGRAHALCYMDLDDFKIVNDSCGHEAGDALLKQLPQLLLPLLRANDTVARLGGDEFAVLLYQCELSDATRIAERIRDAVRGFRFAWQSRSFSVGISIGVICVDASDDSLEALLREADGACYTAKEAAANGVHVVRPHELSAIRHRGDRRWAQRLRDALDDDEGFSLYVQSLHPLEGDQSAATQHELLLRLNDRHGEPVAPGAFLSAARRHGLMPQIDRWVIEQGMARIAPLLQGPVRGHRFGINLSGRSLIGSETLDIIQQELQRHQIEPASLYFEIQETAASLNLGSALNFMRGVRELGCGLALDNFGSGVASFSYLKNLPVDLIKIDGSIIDDLIGSSVNRAIVRGCSEVARCLGIATLAESVESDAQLALLAELGLDYAQGNVFAAPKPLQEWLQAERLVG